MTSPAAIRGNLGRYSTRRVRRLGLTLLTAYVALLPVQITVRLSEVSQATIGPSDLVLFVLFVLCARHLRIVRPAWTIWHTLLLFMMPASALVVSVAVEPVLLSVVFAKVFGLAALSLLFISITTFVETWADARRLLATLATVVVISNVVVTAVYIAGITVPLVNVDGARLSGMLPDPNAYGGLLVVTFALLLATSFSDRPLLGTWATRVAAVSLPLSIALTSSRTTWVSFGIVLIIYAIARPGATLKYVVVAGLALVAVAIFLGPDLAEEQIALGTRGTGGRFELAEAMIDSFWSSPIYGIGIGQFFKQHDLIIHNTVGWFLGEFGLLGFTIIVGLLVTITVWAYDLYQVSLEPAKSAALGLGLAFVGMGVLSLGIEALYQRWWWMIMALIAAIHSRNIHAEGGYSATSGVGGAGTNDAGDPLDIARLQRRATR